MDHKIELKNITKQIRKNTVLDNVSCSFSSGEVTGLVGVNGSGKTMLMRIITGLCVPTEGEALIDGRKLHKDISFPSSCGLLLETPAFIDSFTGFENLKMIASIKKKVSDSDIRECIKKVGLDPDDNKKYRKYSLGMKQRLGIAGAILEKPDIVILDEPTNALDVDGVELVKEIIREQKDRNAVVIVASHDAGIIKELADTVYVMKEGRLSVMADKTENDNE